MQQQYQYQQPQYNQGYQQNTDYNDSSYNYKQSDSNLSQKSRINFIRKVLSIVAVQLTFLAISIIIAQYFKPVQRFMLINSDYQVVFFVGSIISMFCLYFYSQKVPLNYISLGLFTICNAYSVTTLTLGYPVQIVVQAAVLTAAVTISLTIYALQCKKDFTRMGASLFSILTGMICVGILNIFLQSSLIHSLYCLGGVVLYSFYLIYDVQLLTSRSRSIPIDDYILGATTIYIDIVKIFVKILQLLGKDEKDKKKK